MTKIIVHSPTSPLDDLLTVETEENFHFTIKIEDENINCMRSVDIEGKL